MASPFLGKDSYLEDPPGVFIALHGGECRVLKALTIVYFRPILGLANRMHFSSEVAQREATHRDPWKSS
jgi:hypothetical protein